MSAFTMNTNGLMSTDKRQKLPGRVEILKVQVYDVYKKQKVTEL